MEKPAKLQESHSGMATTVSLEVRIKMAENHSQDDCFKCQLKKKMEVLQFFSQLNQVFSFGIVV